MTPLPRETTVENCLDLVSEKKHEMGVQKLFQKTQGEWLFVSDLWCVDIPYKEKYQVAWLPTPKEVNSFATVIFFDCDDWDTAVVHVNMKLIKS